MGFLRKTEKEIKRAGRKIDDEILQPVKNTVEAIIDDPKKLLAVGLAIAFPGAGAFLGAQLGLSGVAAQMVGQTLINTVVNGGDVKSAVISAAIPHVGRGVANTVGTQLAKSGIEDTLNTVIARGAGSAATAATLGRDPLTAFVMGGAGTAVNAITSEIPGFADLPSAAKNSINNAVMAKLGGADPGSAIANTLINETISYAKDAVKQAPINFIEGYFSPGGEGYYDENAERDYQLTTDFGFNPDYSLAPADDGLGLKEPPLPEVFNPDGSVNYDLADYDVMSQIGLNMPKTPNLDSMGGGQGLRIPVEGGFITEDGFIPDNYTPDLGDPLSFINQPAPDGGSPTTADPKAVRKAPAPPKAPNKGLDINALMALLGGGQQAAPAVVSSGQDNSADIELMQDIFGTNLSAPPAGNTDTRTRDLARLMRS